MDHSIETKESLDKKFQSANLFEQKNILVKALFSLKESRSVIEYLSNKNNIIVGLTVFKKIKNDNQFELFYAWWNFDKKKLNTKQEMILESKKQALEYLKSDFLDKNDIYLEITCSDDLLV